MAMFAFRIASWFFFVQLSDLETDMTYTVAVFEVDRAYGGHEEGGWWFNCGQPLEKSAQLPHGPARKRFRKLNQARAYARRLNALLDRDNDDLSSVVCEHHLVAYVCGGKPCSFPSTIPRWE